MTEIKAGSRVRDLVNRYKGKQSTPRGVGTVVFIYPGSGRGGVWPWHFRVRWDDGSTCDRTIKHIELVDERPTTVIDISRCPHLQTMLAAQAAS